MSTTIITELRQRLREVGPRGWPDISTATGVSVHLMRKIAYGDRMNPTLDKVQPLVTHFAIEPFARPAANG